MKRFSALFGLLILITAFNPAHAQFDQIPIDFELEIAPGNTFVHPDDGQTYYKANTDLYLDIKIGNSSGENLIGFIMAFRFYAKINGIETDGAPIVWYDAGGFPEGSIVRMNGWEEWSGSYWEILNEINIRNWDGSLPDSMDHTTASIWTGFPDGEPIQTRLRFHFSIPMSGSDPQTDIIELCIAEYDPFWPDVAVDPFPAYSGFDGPHCYKFLAMPFIPPTIENVPPTMTTSHDVPYFVTFDTPSSEFNTITGAGAVDEYEKPIGIVTPSLWGDQIQWIYDPPCEWINDGLTHTVSFYLEDETRGYVYPDVALYTSALIVTEGDLPEIMGDCESEFLVNIFDTETAEFSINEYSKGGETWSYDVNQNLSGQASLEDGLLSFKPIEDDAGNEYTFTVRVVDCLGNYDECYVTFNVGTSALCGDPNYDMEVNILDVVFLVNAVYKGGPGPGPLEICDVNNDGSINILDIVRMINFKYKDGPALDCPVWE